MSPLAKLELFGEVQTAIAKALGERAQGLATDDMLPLALLVVAHAALPFLASTRAYISLFGASDTMPPHLSFQLATIHAVYEHVMSDVTLSGQTVHYSAIVVRRSDNCRVIVIRSCDSLCLARRTALPADASADAAVAAATANAIALGTDPLAPDSLEHRGICLAHLVAGGKM